MQVVLVDVHRFDPAFLALEGEGIARFHGFRVENGALEVTVVELGRADKLGVQLTLILGQREVLDNTIVVRKMDSGTQETVKLDKVVEEIKKLLKK